MKLIERSIYLQKLIDLRGTPDIKVITGASCIIKNVEDPKKEG